MPNEAELGAIWSAVRGNGGVYGERMVAAAAPGVDARALHVVGRLAALYPSDAPAMPSEYPGHCAQLLGLAGRLRPDRLADPAWREGLPLAYAAGWRGPGAMTGRPVCWAKAHTELTDIGGKLVRRTFDDLADNWVGSPRGFTSPRSVREYVALVLGYFLTPPAAGCPDYQTYWSIHAWDPWRRDGAQNLITWFNQAVRGRSFRPGVFEAKLFAEALVYPELKQTHGLRADNVAFQQCMHPGCDAEVSEYDGRPCPNGHNVFRYMAKPLLILVPDQYAAWSFRQCLKCDYFFKSTATMCPTCKANLSQRPTGLFVRKNLVAPAAAVVRSAQRALDESSTSNQEQSNDD